MMTFADYDEFVKRREVLQHIIDEGTYRDVTLLAGPVAQKLFESVEAAADFLQHESPTLRRASIQALAFYWRISPNNPFATTIRSMARSDVDGNVRQEASTAGACIYAGTDDVVLGELLARKVLDELSDTESRTKAYHGLRRLQHKWLPIRLSLSFSFPDNVDWAYVHRFLDSSRTAEPADPQKTFREVFLKGKSGDRT